MINIDFVATSWDLELDTKKPLFELKLPRFGYRYKYEDGEYSSFSPWSEPVFLPDDFDYKGRKGYNLGMVNSIRKLTVTDFIPYKKSLDITAVDLLYKTTDSPNVYVLKTIERGRDSEWELFSPDNSDYGYGNEDQSVTGSLTITSEMIHKVLPSNQILRAWDNVPITALGQEIVGNRLVYGNYTQVYDINHPVSLRHIVNSYDTATVTDPKKSVKTIRNYKWGMVFGDKYGRETPVVAPGYTNSSTSGSTALTGDVVLEKSFASKQNKFTLTQDWNSPVVGSGTPPDWADYVKYYVKETSNEYYNMVLDYWYWADEQDANIWLSFPSADRNKVD